MMSDTRIGTIGLTARQKECLDFLRSYHAANGIMPSMQEIADHFDWDSKSAAARIIDRLEERGHIRRTYHKAQSIELIEPDKMRAVLLSDEVFRLVQAYAAGQRISIDVAASELLREAMGAA